MGGGGSGGRAARALRLLLFIIMALAVVEYLFGSIMDASLFKTYLYSPLVNTTQASDRLSPKFQGPAWPLKQQTVSKPAVKVSSNKSITESISNTTARLNLQNLTTLRPQEEIVKTTTEPATNASSVIKQLITKDTPRIYTKKNREKLPDCLLPPDLGPEKLNTTEIPLEDVEKEFPEVQWGGLYSPTNCTAKHRVAIIIPYRDRREHLAIFLKHMHPFLMKQQIEYGIFIIEQNGQKQFNRAKLMNVGFVESQKLHPGLWQCFIFHDIDLLPTDSRNLYSCPRQPRHMSASIDKLNYKLPYETIFGGVSALTLEQFTKVNGFSNKYWGWGGEDDDMFYRLNINNYHIARYKMSIARYAMLDHAKQKPNPQRYQLLAKSGKNYKKDGLSTLQYQLVEVCQNHLFTHILVNIDQPHGWSFLTNMFFGKEKR